MRYEISVVLRTLGPWDHHLCIWKIIMSFLSFFSGDWDWRWTRPGPELDKFQSFLNVFKLLGLRPVGISCLKSFYALVTSRIALLKGLKNSYFSSIKFLITSCVHHKVQSSEIINILWVIKLENFTKKLIFVRTDHDRTGQGTKDQSAKLWIILPSQWATVTHQLCTHPWSSTYHSVVPSLITVLINTLKRKLCVAKILPS